MWIYFYSFSILFHLFYWVILWYYTSCCLRNSYLFIVLLNFLSIIGVSGQCACLILVCVTIWLSLWVFMYRARDLCLSCHRDFPFSLCTAICLLLWTCIPFSGSVYWLSVLVNCLSVICCSFSSLLVCLSMSLADGSGLLSVIFGLETLCFGNSHLLNSCLSFRINPEALP